MQKHLTPLPLFLVSLFLGISLTILYFQLFTPHQATLTSQQIKATLPKTPAFSVANAPRDSLRGTMLSLSGTVQWESRTATTPATITTLQTLQQGEELTTQKDGKATIEFTPTCIITLSPSTNLSIIQTLPTNLVFAQSQGTVTYTKSTTTPLAVRSLDALVQLTQGNVTISVDKDTAQMTVGVSSESATIAFNDSQTISNVVTIPSGKAYVFDDSTLTGKFEPLALAN